MAHSSSGPPLPIRTNIWPLVFLIFIITGLYVTLAFALLPELFNPHARGTFNLPVDALYPHSDLTGVVVLHVFFFFIILSLVRAVLTSPGSVPPSWPWVKESARMPSPTKTKKEENGVVESENAKGVQQNGDKKETVISLPQEDSDDGTLRDRDTARPSTPEDEHLLRRRITSEHIDDLQDEELRARILQGRGVEKKNKDGRTRKCKYCRVFKPDRAHHSSVSAQCVLEMDHYCPWINNVVGFFNKKYFFLLVFYSACILVTYCVVLSPHFIESCQHMSSAFEFVVVFCWLLALLLAIATCTFLLFHVWLMLRGYTTIEFCEKRNASNDALTHHGFRVKDLYKRSPYDLGYYRNVQHVLGPYPFLWLIPTRVGMPSKSDDEAGTVFEVNRKHKLVRESTSLAVESTNIDVDVDADGVEEQMVVEL